MKNSKILAGVAVCSVLGLAILPVAGPVLAVDTENANTTVNVRIGETITLAMTGSNPTNIDATPGGAAATATQTATVSTNSAGGYNLTLSMIGSDQKLNNGGNAIDPVTSTALGGDEWGYSLDSGTTYSAVPVVGAPVTIDTAAGAVTGQAKTVTFGAKVTSALPSGNYTNQVVYTATTK